MLKVNKIKDAIENIGLVLVIILGGISGLMVLLICQPFFWLAVIAITLINSFY